MALPDYRYKPKLDQKYPNYKDYASQHTGPKALSRQAFRGHTRQPKPAAPVTPDPADPVIYSPTAPTPDPNRDLSAHPFFDPNANYATHPTQNQSFPEGSLPYNIWATEKSPEGYYYGVMNDRGFGGLDAKSQAAQGMYRDYARGYQAAKMKNAELWFPEYMGMQDVAANVRNLSNRQLGIDENLYAGRDRWSLRGY
jgi:hypothetical protein